VIAVLYTSFPTTLPDLLWQHYLNLLPEEMQMQNSRYRRTEDRHAHLLGRLLLLEALAELNFSNALASMQYTSQGKPYFPGGPAFNISHSGKGVCCVLSGDGSVGIDTEWIRKTDISVFKKLFSSTEWQNILTHTDPLQLFFRYWTIKESVIKAEGKGLAIPLNQIKIKTEHLAVYGQTEWHLTKIGLFEDHCTTLATSVQTLPDSLTVRRLDFYNRM
jgi:4'-phosphopantetheinyl transferase